MVVFVVVVVVLWSVLVCPEAVVPLLPLDPLACAKLMELIRARANVMLRSFFTVFFSSWG